MFRLCRHTLLAVLTVLAVLCGLAHQIHDRFAMHHHCVETDACCDHRGDQHSPDHEGKACDHAMCAHSMAALAESPAQILFRSWIAVASTPEFSQRPPVVDPAEIDHPPQLA